LVALFTAAPAAALDCEGVMNMVEHGVDPDVVAQAMEAYKYSADDIRCLYNAGAPDAIIDKARSLASSESTTPEPEPSTEPEPELEPSSSFDNTDTLGGDSLGDDVGSDESLEPAGPEKLEKYIRDYRTKKFLTASLGFYTILKAEAYPEYDSKTKYYLAKTLYELGMYHSAQHYYMEVVRKGPSNPYFKHALPRLAAIAEYTGNDYELLRLVHKVPPEEYPRQARPHLYYLMGRKMYESGELSDAAAYFSQVPESSDLYLRAQYFEGVIHHQRGKLQSAVKAFRKVIKTDVPVGNSREHADLENLKDLSIINIARIYFGLQRYDNADKYYSRVQRDSIYWAESLFERSWTNFYRSDLNHTLGLLLTVDSPYYTGQEFVPELVYLQALTYFNFCEYDEVNRVVANFDARYKPVAKELKGFLERYKTEEGRRLPDQAFEQYFGDSELSSTIPKSLWVRVLRNRDLSSLIRHMDIMDEEIQLVDQQKSRWRDDIGEQLKKVVERDRLRYKKRAGQILLQELLDQYRIVDGLLQDMDILKFEVVDAQRVGYEFRAAQPDVDSMETKLIDFATAKDITYWPFNGEFWEDELGYYRYTEHGSCK